MSSSLRVTSSSLRADVGSHIIRGTGVASDSDVLILGPQELVDPFDLLFVLIEADEAATNRLRMHLTQAFGRGAGANVLPAGAAEDYVGYILEALAADVTSTGRGPALALAAAVGHEILIGQVGGGRAYLCDAAGEIHEVADRAGDRHSVVPGSAAGRVARLAVHGDDSLVLAGLQVADHVSRDEIRSAAYSDFAADFSVSDAAVWLAALARWRNRQGASALVVHFASTNALSSQSTGEPKLARFRWRDALSQANARLSEGARNWAAEAVKQHHKSNGHANGHDGDLGDSLPEVSARVRSEPDGAYRVETRPVTPVETVRPPATETRVIDVEPAPRRQRQAEPPALIVSAVELPSSAPPSVDSLAVDTSTLAAVDPVAVDTSKPAAVDPVAADTSTLAEDQRDAPVGSSHSSSSAAAEEVIPAPEQRSPVIQKENSFLAALASEQQPEPIAALPAEADWVETSSPPMTPPVQARIARSRNQVLLLVSALVVAVAVAIAVSLLTNVLPSTPTPSASSRTHRPISRPARSWTFPALSRPASRVILVISNPHKTWVDVQIRVGRARSGAVQRVRIPASRRARVGLNGRAPGKVVIVTAGRPILAHRVIYRGGTAHFSAGTPVAGSGK